MEKQDKYVASSQVVNINKLYRTLASRIVNCKDTKTGRDGERNNQNSLTLFRRTEEMNPSQTAGGSGVLNVRHTQQAGAVT